MYQNRSQISAATARSFLICLVLLSVGFLMGLVIAAKASDVPEQPWVPCVVISVSDGDTVKCRMKDQWGPRADGEAMRIYGIDTPESRAGPNGAKCALEKKRGLIAKVKMKELVKAGSVVQVQWVETAVEDRSGRPIVNVTLPNGKDWAAETIRLGIAREYALDGNLKKSDWCSK